METTSERINRKINTQLRNLCRYCSISFPNHETENKGNYTPTTWVQGIDTMNGISMQK